MRGVGAIFRRELAGLFLQPLAWVLLSLALFFNGWLLQQWLYMAGGDVTVALSAALGGAGFWILLCVLAPLVTMRMISEEARSGLLEYLLTAPVADAAVVVGKYLAATVFFAVLWASVPTYGLVFHLLGTAPDWGQLSSAYVGAVLVSSLFCALGLVASALTATPALSAFLAFLMGIGLLLLPGGARALEGFFGPGTLDQVVEKIDLVQRLAESFMVGAIDSGHVVFFLAWIGAWLFLAVRLLEAKRWR